ncbi:hypothetical protein Q5P01_000644 [Channa striata]|uniref:Uncharacterized protein n=1 Tax=Channa striata TaxID=64152 RepID=A0AA88LMZ9_CHASR|nr:hypothetical protein Q5P01_000644 [Channa striata]
MTRATLRTTRRRRQVRQPSEQAAGRAVCAEGKRRDAGRPAWTQPRTKEEEERLQDAQGQPDGGAAAAAGPARGGRDDATEPPPERPRRRSGQGAFRREKGRGSLPPTPGTRGVRQSVPGGRGFHRAVTDPGGADPRTSLNHPIGSSDGRCVQRAGT